MDEKGFPIGKGQDGNREWVTVMATTCGDGSTLPPAVDAGKHTAYSAARKNGWTNDELGCHWLVHIFDKATSGRARRRWLLLFVDSHGSHLNLKFLQYYIAHKILPLDVGLFFPLGNNYSQRLNSFTNMSLGQTTMTKRSFFGIFWPAFEKAFTKENSSAKLGTSTRQLRLKVGMVSRRAGPETRKVLQELSQSALNTAARLTLAEYGCSNLEKSLALERRKRKRKPRLLEQVRGMEGYGGAIFVETGQQADAKEREEQEKAQRAREREEAKALKAAETLRKRQERQAAKDARMAAKARKKAAVAARKAAAQRKDDDDDDDDYVEEWQPRRSTRQTIVLMYSYPSSTQAIERRVGVSLNER
ncbi:hypothetical protein K470DRAFT_256232, partial [Piedraia hortae CBS 480.64]